MHRMTVLVFLLGSFGISYCETGQLSMSSCSDILIRPIQNSF